MRWGVQSEEQPAATAATKPSVRLFLRGRFVRLSLIGLVCSLWFGGVMYRLWDLQVRQSDSFSSRAERQQQGTIRIHATRGRIYDRQGAELALSSPVQSIGVFPKQVEDAKESAKDLARFLDEPVQDIERTLSAERFQWLRRLADPKLSERLQNVGFNFLHFEEETKRYYPKGSLAAHLLGFVNIDHKGLAGLELLYSAQLAGRDGERVVHHDVQRKSYDSTIAVPPVPGKNLYLTIDERIQSVAEKRLEAAIHETGARKGSVIVMDPNHGDILAMASWPTFDPNQRALNGADWNYAIRERYEPGSTFKIVTVAAALESGITTPDEVIDCENGSILIGRRRVRDHKAYDLLTVSDVLANSSNVGVIKLGLRLGAPRLREFVTNTFHFGESTGIELPQEDHGTVHPLRFWRDGSVASISMGHELTVTPLQMVQAMSIIANGGYLVRPRIVDAIDSYGEKQPLERPAREQVLSATTAAQMRAMLERTILSGTGRLAHTPGYRAGGKTGTAQMVDQETGRYSHDEYMASFLGMAPINDPKVVILVVLEAPQGEYYGGQVAAPVFREVAAQALRLLDVPPDQPVLPAPRRSTVPAELLADFVEMPTDEPARLTAAADGSILVSRSVSAQLPAEASVSGDTTAVRLRVTGLTAPDLHGMTLRQVFAKTSSLGLTVDPVGAGVVVKQSPPAGTPMEEGGLLQLELGRLIAGAVSAR
jgi:cell division protein FtsI (penicillin-binding protein 3)